MYGKKKSIKKIDFNSNNNCFLNSNNQSGEELIYQKNGNQSNPPKKRKSINKRKSIKLTSNQNKNISRNSQIILVVDNKTNLKNEIIKKDNNNTQLK